MASRVMHIAVASQLEKILPIKDKNRFFIGHILPDAVLSANKHDVNTHFTEIFENGKRKHFDYYEFFDRYKNEILSDELYLGYYFHLIEDCIFRVVLYYDTGLLSRRGDPDFLCRLYRDYHIINGWSVERYGLECDLYEPKNYRSQKINEIYSFEVEDFIKDMQSDFNEKINQEPECFKIKNAENFIEKCVEVCASEYAAIKKGSHSIGAYDYSWETQTSSSK